MRRDGVWRGKRLLTKRFMTEAITPTKTNGCYGWLIWLNAGSPCVGPTIQDRPVENNREWPDLPKDLYRFSGLFGQLVTVFPSQDVVVVRTGQDPSLAPTGGQGWEHDLYAKVLGAITDEKVEPAGDAKVADDGPNADYGFQTSLQEPDQYSKGVEQDPLPPAGPLRARAAWLELNFGRVSRTGGVTVRLGCPPRPARPCAGTATLEGARGPARYSVAPDAIGILRFTLTKRSVAALKRAGTADLTVIATNADAANGVSTAHRVTVTKPRPKKISKRRR
jgi:hypothetical protein